LSITPTDQTNILTWTEKTPWTNFKYIIYRRNTNTGNFDSIGFSIKNTYRDEGLENGKEYCYFVKSYGAYSVKGIRQPLINRSQELCSIPIDNVPPCPPLLAVKNICNDKNISLSDTSVNYLIWNNIRRTCATGKDASGYQIYFTPLKGGKFEEISKITFYNDTIFNHDKLSSLAGCYYITAFDSLKNISAPSNIVCVDNCPIYELPNTFTPNGDGQNDFYRPFSTARFIAKVDFQIFNRWGGLVFKTTDPHLNWDGKNLAGNELAEGVYYYTCKVYEQRVEGIVPQEKLLNGFIQIFR
jgi:gliding motility-associated-like protein